ncbi:MAG: septal ring lytic transglycosylase RlpA family protein [Psychrobium sp.]
MLIHSIKRLIIGATILSLGACTLMPSQSRYDIEQDHAPSRLPTDEEIADIEPQYLPPSRWANNDYQVRGQHYQVLKDAAGYKAQGIASWYGQKFHGHDTSNGEVFNMYGLSAAHKTLPIPSFVKVTNLENNRSTIVRVNDRGPFHPDRIIDLSYGAAYKLGVLKHGTARVAIEVVSPKKPQQFRYPECFIQLAANSDKQRATEILSAESKTHRVPYTIESVGKINRLLLGPIVNLTHCESVLKKVQNNFPKAFIKMP